MPVKHCYVTITMAKIKIMTSIGLCEKSKEMAHSHIHFAGRNIKLYNPGESLGGCCSTNVKLLYFPTIALLGLHQ